MNPVASSFPISVEAVLMAIVGGTGTILGPFLGAGVILGLRNWVSSFVEMHLAIMGLVFIATVLWAPDGLVGPGGPAARPVLEEKSSAVSTPAIHVDSLAKVFGGLAAVDGVSLEVRGGRAARADRPERRRQDDAVPLRHRHARSRRAAASRFSAAT